MRHLLAGRALRRLELTVTRRLDGLLQGDHLGLVPGPGTEPAEARPYLVGDDVRRMDWNVTARVAEPHVRDLVADRELETWVLLDASASMDFGTGDMEKRDLALAAVAAVGFLTERAGNRIGAHILHGGPPAGAGARHGRGVARMCRGLLGGTGIPRGSAGGAGELSGSAGNAATPPDSAGGAGVPRGVVGGARVVPARGGRAHLMALLHAISVLPRAAPGKRGRPLGPHAERLAGMLRRRGLVVVVSDFLDDPGTWERPLRRLATRHQLLAVEVIDPRELTLPDVGMLTLVDPETGRRREVSTASARLRERYAAAAAAQRGAVEAALRRTGAAHLRLRTDRDWVTDLIRHVLTQRRATAAAGGPG
ncbi:DUF58 domain-containing protein [Spongiactinospora gelatinilytica]|uniref:DUF58 domain-containing protein n=1 Tax=Spongiactinospora gelatinilytica TaxID=2666298 RepID=A0A2W2H2C0_9ACTN|nr:DUF58 domain-containing protein [Spongiactinospora gelatinilytica]PZG49069.1 DUF58 domain-containing protein [Spongiactinospora gelatinilytica]